MCLSILAPAGLTVEPLKNTRKHTNEVFRHKWNNTLDNQAMYMFVLIERRAQVHACIGFQST